MILFIIVNKEIHIIRLTIKVSYLEKEEILSIKEMSTKNGEFAKIQKEELLFDERINVPLFPRSLIQIDGREHSKQRNSHYQVDD